ncbi:MAG: hypothetical protein NXH97_02645 [Rhodobacteraceae bacterium]|nr:hypothetical protein [Paracoccaceae bacterium]
MKKAFLLFLLLLGTPAAATEVPIDNRFFQFGARFQDNSSVMVLASPRNVGGKLAICGVYWTTGGTPRVMREIGPAYVKQLEFAIGDTALPKKNWRFSRIRNSGDPTGQPARCTVLNVAWTDQMARMPLRPQSTRDVIRAN